jgi:hypothetical protein
LTLNIRSMVPESYQPRVANPCAVLDQESTYPCDLAVWTR